MRRSRCPRARGRTAGRAPTALDSPRRWFHRLSIGGVTMRFDDESKDGPELVLREPAAAAIETPRRSSGLLGGVVVLVCLILAVALGFYGRAWFLPGGGTQAVQA